MLTGAYKLMSDSIFLVKCIVHTGELDDDYKAHVRLFLHIEMHTGAYKLMSDSVSKVKCIQFS